MKLAPEDRRKLTDLLGELARAVEELLLTGLTTVSPATRRTLDVSFREASRLRFLRLSSTLRVANEELGRYTAKDADFSGRRLAFFLNRAWLLSHGLSRALRDGDQQEFDRLSWTPASQPVPELRVVTVGVSKKVSRGAFCAFEFRLRAIQDAGNDIKAGQRLSWSCIFPLKVGVEIPAEGFLHLPQKQKFKAMAFLERKVIAISGAAVAMDGFGGGRISLGERAVVSLGDEFTDWQRFLTWDIDGAVRRIRDHQPGPLDLEVDIQEEMILDTWQLGEATERREGQLAYPMISDGTAFDAMVSTGIEGQALMKRLEVYRKKKTRPPLLGLLHYEMCRLVVQPLTVFEKRGPVHLMISDEKIDRAALLKTLKF